MKKHVVSDPMCSGQQPSAQWRHTEPLAASENEIFISDKQNSNNVIINFHTL